MQLEIGMTVRRIGERTAMVVINLTGSEAECGWYLAGQLNRQYFPLAELVIVSTGYEYLSFT